jgi:O-antigen ligase
MSGNEASMVHALAALAGYAFILRRLEPDAAVTSWLLSLLFSFSLAVLAGIMLGDIFSESVVGQAASDAYKAFDYLPVFWESAWSGFTDHWINGVGIRGWGSMVVSMESITVLPVSERWHPHMYALEVAVDTGVPGLIGYGLFFIFLGRRLFDARSEVALTSLVVILALFPLNSSVSFYSYFNGNILFLTLALLIALDRDIKSLPELNSLGQADATGLQ